MATERIETPTVVVAIDAGRASVETLIGAIDSALASELDGLSVHVALAETDPRHETVAHLCGADPRVAIASAAPPESAPDVLIEIPARARPQPRTVPELIRRAGTERLGSISVRVPGFLGASARLQVKTGGSGSRRVRATDVGLRSTRSRGEPGPPPQGDLATERAEHLRHRARSSTMRARLDRYQHRLARERLQVRHERARVRFAEEQLGRTGAGEWIRWRGRVVGRRVAALPGVARSATRTARGFARRGRRFAADRLRSRPAPAEEHRAPGRAAEQK